MILSAATQGRNVDSIPNRFAIRRTQPSSPKGRTLCTLSRCQEKIPDPFVPFHNAGGLPPAFPSTSSISS